MKIVSAVEALQIVNSNNRIYVQAAAATPSVLTKALTDRAAELRNVELCHLHTEGECWYADPKLSESFHVNSFFIGQNVRQTLAAGNGSYTPVFLSEVPQLFNKKILPLDVAFIHVSPPDGHGYCSLGVSVEATLAAVRNAKYVIAQINPQMPRTFGDSVLDVDAIDFGVEVNQPLFCSENAIISEIEQKIGIHVAQLIEDRATLQMGIGSIPNAVLSQLHHHKGLGLHTEMFSDGVIPLIESGVIDCQYKKLNNGRAIATFLMGSQKLYDFVNDNPFIEMREASYVNNAHKISQNYRMTAINSAIEVDLTGQVCADSIGTKMYSGVGGQMDFIRGASMSETGKAIIALPSTTKKGESRIVPFLKQGAGVVTTRANVHYIVTEFGTANLYGKTLQQRAKELIGIAHPQHQENLERAYVESLKSL